MNVIIFAVFFFPNSAYFIPRGLNVVHWRKIERQICVHTAVLYVRILKWTIPEANSL